MNKYVAVYYAGGMFPKEYPFEAVDLAAAVAFVQSCETWKYIRPEGSVMICDPGTGRVLKSLCV